MLGGRLGTTVGLVMLGIATAAPGYAQPPTPTPDPTPCPSPTPSCPPPTTGESSFVHINVVPQGNSCAFAANSVPKLETILGGSAQWTFCSTCPVDTMVDLEARPPQFPAQGPFSEFSSFTPSPLAHNRVQLALPCNNHSLPAFGTSATTEGEWKYHLTLRPANGIGMLHEIDPRIEIDDSPFAVVRWLERLLLIFASLLLGGYFTWLRMRARP